MPADRTNRATALLIELPEDTRPMHERLTSAIRTAIARGRLTPGHLLPSSRTLAAELGCSRWVVNEAYVQLAAEGHLETRQGSGTRIAAYTTARTEPSRAEFADPEPPTSHVDLRPGAPDVNGFPAAAWLRSLHHVLTDPAWSPPVFPPPAGAPRLRQTVAAYLRRARGILVDSDDVIITCGTSHGIAAVARTLTPVALGVAVEDPGWARLREVAAAAGLRIEPVTVDAKGIDVAAVRRADVAAAICAPAHQFPTGALLSPERRRALLTWATEASAIIVEDDYDAEFRYDGRPVGALAGLSRDHVVYLGSASKTLHPGLRLGWLVPPPARRRALLAAVEAAGAGPSILDQLTFAHFMETGAYDRHLRQTRKTYRLRRNALVTALQRHNVTRRLGAPQGIAAGLHLTLPLPPKSDEHAVVARLADLGVTAIPLSRYTIRPQPPALVLGYGRLAPPRAEWVAMQIAKALHAHSPSSSDLSWHGST
ncbi:MocR-like pyridoxine biosynthesis transcription factor PdxR [Actinoplanes aureus]|uniref:PLP-dependent aminotransferase family protein n=1 Tax=Actinoplanes aureus TaxID=2792083 RepID=A0A931FXS8_9ACTN|nr:PLP-dependent aminotransferase family protein [Actinoplanes aureus]MBG0563878.1 PLP-dependent aminotransferase family protein [Actinoplanes aureus]